MKKQKSQKELQAQIDKFNSTYGIGCKVDIQKDDGSIICVTVANKATIMGGHSAVGWFQEIRGCYSLDRVNN